MQPDGGVLNTFFRTMIVVYCSLLCKVGLPTSYKWSYNPYKWHYKWETQVTTPISEVIALLIAGRGSPCQHVQVPEKEESSPKQCGYDLSESLPLKTALLGN